MPSRLIGVHTVMRSGNPEADRSFFRDVLGLGGIDAGGGYHIVGLPPAELSIHEVEGGAGSDLHLMCDDVAAFVATMRERDVACAEVIDTGWGLLTHVTLPGGGRLAVYEAKHARPRATPTTRRKRARPSKPRPQRRAKRGRTRRRSTRRSR